MASYPLLSHAPTQAEVELGCDNTRLCPSILGLCTAQVMGFLQKAMNRELDDRVNNVTLVDLLKEIETLAW